VKNSGTKKQSTVESKKSWNNMSIAFILAAIAIILFANTFNHDFTVDDALVISENKIVKKGISGIGEIWTSSYLQGYNNEVDAAYRPISLTQFAIEKTLFNGSSSWMHIMHVLYYALGIFFCYLFCSRLFKGNKILAISTTILFLAHPIHTEVVNNLKSRDEIMMMVGLMGMGYFYLQYLQTDKSKSIILSLLSLFVALFSKETAISTFLLIPAIYIWDQKAINKNTWLHTTYFLGVCLFYLLIRTIVVGTYNIEMDYMNNALLRDGGNFIQRFPDAMTLMGKYLIMLVFPYPLSVDYSYNSIPLNGWSNPLAYASILSFIGLLVGAFYGLKRKSLYGLLCVWFLVTIVVASNVFILIGSTFAERFLFVPSFAFCAALAFGFHQLFSKKVWIVTALIALVYCAWTLNRNSHWKTNNTLFSRDVKFQEDNARVLTFYGKFLYDEAKSMETDLKDKSLDSALEALDKAVDIAPDYLVANYYQGFVLKEKNDIEKATSSFAKVVELEPNFKAAKVQYAIALSKNNDHKKAIDQYKWLLENGKNDFTVVNNLAYSYLKSKDYRNAETYYLQAYALQPNNKTVLSNLIKLYRDGMNNQQEALKYNAILKELKG